MTHSQPPQPPHAEQVNHSEHGEQTRCTIEHLLAVSRTIAVVGLSPKPERASYDVARYMQAKGYRIIPVNPHAGVLEILGEKVYASLLDASQFEHVDLVNCFRNSEDVAPIVEEAIAIHAHGVWMQLGVTHPAAAAKAQQAGLQVVQNHCLKTEHRSLKAAQPG